MDNFVKEIKKSFARDMKNNYKINSRFRNLLNFIMLNPPPVEIIEIKNDGDIIFSILTADIGLSFGNYIKYKTEILSSFFANFLGELLVRENIDQFTPILTNIKDEKYLSTVNGYTHTKFGIKIFQDKFIFTFHMSLLQSILTEDFKKHIEIKLK